MNPHNDLTLLEASSSGDKPLTRSQKKNARKKQRVKDSKSNEVAFVVEELVCGIEGMKIEPERTGTADVTEDSSVHCDDANAMQKRIRNLKKKLKQIEELEVRLDSGENLEREQHMKISKKEEFIDELLLMDSTD